MVKFSLVIITCAPTGGIQRQGQKRQAWIGTEKGGSAHANDTVDRRPVG